MFSKIFGASSKASTEETSKTQKTYESLDNWTDKLKEPAKELRKTGEDPDEKPTLEIALLMDCTSSMASWIEKAKQTLHDIVNSIVEECKEDGGNLKVRVCFVGYRDIKDRKRFAVKEFTEDIDSVKQFINGTHAEGGADEPEDLQGGLKLALLQDWTEEASKRVFIICDAPCHGKSYHSCHDDFPEGSPDGLVLEDLMKEFCKKDIEFQFIKLMNNCEKMIQVMKECHQEIEVTDMTNMQSNSDYLMDECEAYAEDCLEDEAYREESLESFARPTAHARLMKEDFLCDEAESDYDEAECDDYDDAGADDMIREKAITSFGARKMKAAMTSAPKEMASSKKDDYYRSEAIRCTVNQIKRNKASRKK